MNLNRKVDMQERTIKSLQEKIEKLKYENKALREENAELSDKNQHYEQIVGDEKRFNQLNKQFKV